MSKEEVLRMRFGSYNYNLETPESDKDYKVFVLPTKEDLFYGRSVIKEFTVNNIDFKYHDIRTLANLLIKSNLNFIEGFFSDDIIILDKYKPSDQVKDPNFLLIKEFLDLKDEIARLNISRLYQSSTGMSYSEQESMNKKYIKNDEKGWRKAMLSSYRILDFLIRFEESNFEDLRSSMRYTDEERVKLLDFRDNSSFEDGLEELKKKRRAVGVIRESFMSHELNQQTLEKIDSILMQLVFNNI